MLNLLYFTLLPLLLSQSKRTINMFLFSLYFVFGIWRSNVYGFVGGFSMKFIADLGCEISWVWLGFTEGFGWLFWAFLGCFMRVLMVSFWSCFSVSKGIVRIFLGWFPMAFGSMFTCEHFNLFLFYILFWRENTVGSWYGMSFFFLNYYFVWHISIFHQSYNDRD